jgi:hypothetical protein
MPDRITGEALFQLQHVIRRQRGICTPNDVDI